MEPDEAVTRLNAIFGSPSHCRALHAKGRFYRGTFTATPEAAQLSRAAHLTGAEVPVLVRFSNGSGDPSSKDSAMDVHGMAVSFRPPGGEATDIIGLTMPRFPVGTPADFVRLVRAVSPGIGQLWRLPAFLLSHLGAVPTIVANNKAGASKPPISYACCEYHAVHAYKWTAADGSSRWVRYTLVPVAKAEGTRPPKASDYLGEELAGRLRAAPVEFTLRVTVAGEGDDPNDATAKWADGRTTVDVGTISITVEDPAVEADGGVVVFDPTRVIDGIELSDDPILHYRSRAYAVSAARRAKE